MTNPLLLGARSAVRTAWRRLISMRTALVLLFLLALAAVPGSLLPQRPLNPAKVQSYLKTHGAWGRLIDGVGGFDVFGSFWFAAVYLLLFVSLIGCLIPRIRVYARALRAKPLKAPRNLSRLAENGRLSTGLSPQQAAERARRMLRPRWRTVVRVEEAAGGLPAATTVSAEKGYTREAGNLLFHVALLAALILIAAGRLNSYQGSVVVSEGTGFCNTLVAYDSFHSGRSVNQGTLAPFCIDRLNSFSASYRSDGTPAQFRADVTYSEHGSDVTKHDVITVNHPLRLLGDRVYLINHGFSPTVTVTRPGQAPVTQSNPFLAQDAFLTSEGVFKLVGPAGANQDIGLQGLFAPTPEDKGGGVITSVSPQARNPVLALFAYTGDTGVNNGLPQSVYTLDTTKMTKVGAKNLSVGQTMTLPGGTTVRFDGYQQWASLQVSHDPTQTYLLIAAILMVTGLLCSLVVRRRRVWLRLVAEAVDGADAAAAPPASARTLIEVGGLARNDSGNFATEFEALLASLRAELHEQNPTAGNVAVAVPASAGKD